jgi:hypothetical protein
MRTVLSTTSRDGLTCAIALNEVLHELEGLPDLGPSPRADALFGRLVRIVVETPEPVARVAMDHLDPARFQRVGAQGEHLLEAVWAERISAGAPLTDFPYLDNYHRLSALEARPRRPPPPPAGIGAADRLNPLTRRRRRW